MHIRGRQHRHMQYSCSSSNARSSAHADSSRAMYATPTANMSHTITKQPASYL